MAGHRGNGGGRLDRLRISRLICVQHQCLLLLLLLSSSPLGNAQLQQSASCLGPNGSAWSPAANYLPEDDVCRAYFGDNSLKCCSDNQGLVKKFKTYTRLFGQCGVCVEQLKRMECSLACHPEQSRYFAAAAAASNASAAPRRQPQICPDLCWNLYQSCKTVHWEDKLEYLLRDEVSVCGISSSESCAETGVPEHGLKATFPFERMRLSGTEMRFCHELLDTVRCPHASAAPPALVLSVIAATYHLHNENPAILSYLTGGCQCLRERDTVRRRLRLRVRR